MCTVIIHNCIITQRAFMSVFVVVVLLVALVIVVVVVCFYVAYCCCCCCYCYCSIVLCEALRRYMDLHPKSTIFIEWFTHTHTHTHTQN